MEIFKLFGTIAINGADKAENIIDGISEKGGKLGKVLGGIGSFALKGFEVVGTAVAGASTALGGLVAKSTNAYADYEQLVGGAELMFGEAYDFIADKAKNAYSTVQMSQNDYLQQVNGFAVGLKTALEGDEMAAAQLADRIITAEADIVSATGNSQEAVQNAFNGIMKSNFTMLDNLQIGITPTKEGFQQVIDKVNEWNETQGRTTNYVIDNLADCQSALVDYVEMQGLAGYAANEASGTIQGSLAMVKSAWENLITDLGRPDADISQSINNLIDSAATFLNDNLIPRVQQILANITENIPSLVPKLIKAISNLVSRAGPDLIKSAEALLKELANVILDFIPGMSNEAKTAIENCFNGILSFLINSVGMIKKIIEPIFEFISSIVVYISNDIFPILKEFVIYLKDKFVAIFNNIKEIIKDNSEVFETLKDVVKKVFEVVKDVGKILLDFIEWITGSSEGAEKLRVVIEGVAVAFATYKVSMLAMNAATAIGTKVIEAYRKAALLLKTTNPFGWVLIAISAIAGLTFAIKGMAESSEIDKIREKYAQLTEEEQAVVDQTKELKEQTDAMFESVANSAKNIGGTFSIYDDYLIKLDNIVDANGRIKEGHEEEAEYIKNKLKEDLGYEIEIRDGIIQKYDEQKQSIQELITLKQAEAALSSLSSDYAEAKSTRNEKLAAAASAEQAYNDVYQQMQSAMEARSELEPFLEDSNLSSEELKKINEDYATLTATIDGLSERLYGEDGLAQAKNNADEALMENNQIIESMDALETAVAKRDIPSIQDSLLNLENSFITCKNGTERALRKQAENFRSSYESMKLAAKKEGSAITDAAVANAHTMYLKSIEEYAKLKGESISEVIKTIEGIEGLKEYAGNAGRGLANELSEAFINAAAEQRYRIETAWSNIVNGLSSISPSVTINSASDFVYYSSKNLAGHAKGGIVTKEHIARVGEDGAEAIIPLEKNTEWIDNVAKRLNGNTSDNAVLEKLDELNSNIKNLGIYLDGKTLVGSIAPQIDSALGSIARLKKRGAR